LARTEESLVWTQTSSGSFVSLAYGTLDTSKHPVFLLTCFNGMDVASLDLFGVIEGSRPGQPLEIALSAGSAEHVIQGGTEIDDKTGSMFAEASDIEVGPVLDVLKAPGPLTIKMAFTTQTLSDQGRADAAEKFGEACQVG
jgi:hypothetical protein